MRLGYPPRAVDVRYVEASVLEGRPPSRLDPTPMRFLFAAVLLAACDTAEPPSTPADLDPDVAPVLEGEWARPAADITWQWQLSGSVNSGYDVDLYDVDLWETSDATMRALQARGVTVLCYFSAGSGDRERDDYSGFAASDLGRALDGFPSERWLDVRSQTVWDAMMGRLDLAVARGCDGVEPDNVDGYTNDSGFDLTARDQLAFVRNLANEAHRRGLAFALKNAGDQAADLEAYTDLELNEECHLYDECSQLAPFTRAGKPVLNVEYVDTRVEAEALARTVCPASRSAGLRTLILPFDLDNSFRVSCFD